MTGYIYKYENLINHKVYIGQTVNLAAREASHKSKSQTVKNKFYNAVRKYGWNNFKCFVIATVEAEDIKELSVLLDSLEEQYIEQYDSYLNGYNATTGGHSCRGKQMPASFIEYCKNRTYSEETRRKMSNSAKGKVISEKTREKQRKIAIDREFYKYGEIYGEKRIAGIRKVLSKAVVQLDRDGTIVNTFPSMHDTVIYIVKSYAPDRVYKGIYKGLYRHIKGETKKRLYYGYEWKLCPKLN